MAHDKVCGICQPNKCLVEVEPKTGTDAVEARVSTLETGKAPNNHATTTDTYGKGTSSNYGHVKLNDSVNSTSDAANGGTAATPKAIKSVADRVSNLELGSFPIGAIVPYAGSNAPNANWLICNGQGVNASTYSALYSVIGTKYGGNSTTFNLPNLQGRVPIGVSSSHALGTTGGAETHTLSINEIPSHNHVMNITLGNLTSTGSNVKNSSESDGTYSKSTNNTGGGGAHNNMQPFITLNYIIRAK